MRTFVAEFWSELNRGDAAMQVCIVDRLHSMDASISLNVDYGWNEYRKFLNELDHTGSIIGEDAVLPGNRVSFHDRFARSSRWVRRTLVVWTFVANSFIQLWTRLAARFGLPQLAPAAAKALWKAIDGADLIVWNGRNFRSNSAFREIMEIADLLWTPWTLFLAKRTGQRLVALGVSVWPLRTRLGRLLVRRALAHCDLVYAREADTLEYLRGELGLIEARPMPDLSFHTLNALGRPERALQSGQRVLGLALKEWTVDGPEARDAYLSSVVGFATDLHARGEITSVLFVDQVPMEKESTEAIRNEAQAMLDGAGIPWAEAHGRLTISELLDVYAACCLVLSSRMHGAIFAIWSGAPTITISYDTGAKWSILRGIGVFSDLPIREISTPRLREIYSRLDEYCPVDEACARMEAGAIAIDELDAWRV
jgi:polysaccharide pyruvyl transferase WcaK-like protein